MTFVGEKRKACGTRQGSSKGTRLFFGRFGWSGILLVGWLGETFAVAFLDTAHACEQLVIGSGTEFFALTVEHLHHQRIEDADFLQCCHAAVDAGESDCTKGASLKPARSISQAGPTASSCTICARYCTFTCSTAIEWPIYLSTATTTSRCSPELSEIRLFSWSPSFW
jgi:hypothetical protein